MTDIIRQVERIENGFSNMLRTPFRLAWLECGHAVKASDTAIDLGSEVRCESCERERADLPALRDAIADPKFTHARFRRGSVYIYHRDRESPSGVRFAACGREQIVDPILVELGRPSAISPTEPR